MTKNGPLCCQLGGVEVMGRDISVVSSHAASQAPVIRSIISSESSIDLSSKTIRFAGEAKTKFSFLAVKQKKGFTFKGGSYE